MEDLSNARKTALTISYIGFLVVLISCHPARAQGSIVANGSFEVNIFDAEANTWHHGGDFGQSFFRDNAADGFAFVDMEPTGWLFQDLGTLGGQSYSLSVALSGNSAVGDSTAGIFWDGYLIGQVDLPRSSYQPTWVFREYSLTALGDITRLEFRNLSSLQSSHLYVDAVRVTPVPVPEPVRSILILFGTATLLVWHRSKRVQGGQRSFL